MISNVAKTNSLRALFGNLKTFAAQSTACGYATAATFETKAFKLHNLDQGTATAVTVTKDDTMKYYSQMYAIRRMETASGNMYKEKIIRGFYHQHSGQEACAV